MTCPCCAGTGEIDPDERPLCGCAILQRDPRPVDQLRRLAFLQQLALHGVVHDGSELLPVIVVDWRRPADARDYPVSAHPLTRPPDVDLFDASDAVCSYVHRHRHADPGELLYALRAFDQEHGRAAVVAGLEAARRHIGELPGILEDLLSRLTPEGWSA